MALLLDKRLGRGIHSFLEQLTMGVELIPGLEWLILGGVNPDRMLHFLHSLFSIQVDL